MSANITVGTDTQQRLRVMYTYGLLALLSLAIFGFLQVAIEDNDIVGYLELAGAGAVLLTVLGLRATGNLAIARWNLLLTMTALLVVMLTTGGTGGTGILWFFMFPVAAFFLAGKREGTAWMIWLLAITLIVWGVSSTDAITIYYADLTVRQLLVTLLVVSVGLYVYQSSREAWEAHARSSEHQLRQYLKQMSALHTKVEHAKSEFVTLASHQLRTPISAIGWSSEMLLSGDAGKLEQTQTEYIQGIYDSNRRLEAIVDAMLLVSSLELGTIHIRPEPTDLPALARKILKDELKRVPQRKFSIHETYGKIAKLPLDPHLIKQIIQVLISNAIKYTADGGSITISIEPSKELLSPKSQGSIVITVSDSGYGIPDAEQQNVFAKLFRAANIKTKDVDGTGLGLYIVKTILDQVGGKVTFASTENKGSTFVVALPQEGMAKWEGRSAGGVHV